MAGIITHAFSDKDLKPSEELIFAVIGERKKLWQKIMAGISGKYTNAEGDWNYYNDGKQWLFKCVLKKKTIFWGAVLTTGEFRITFYFPDRAEPLISDAAIPQKVKDDFRTAKKYGSIRPATLIVNSDEDADTVLKLAEIRVNLK